MSRPQQRNPAFVSPLAYSVGHSQAHVSLVPEPSRSILRNTVVSRSRRPRGVVNTTITPFCSTAVEGSETPQPSEGNGKMRMTDARGFVIPERGDVVLYSGRWANEDSAGLVENVRYLEARGTDVVDVVEMKNVGTALYAASKTRKWFDIADVRIASDAEYVANQDAYRIKSARTGYADIGELDPNVKELYDAEYGAMKTAMLKTTALVGAGGTILAAVLAGIDNAYAFALGATAGLTYLFMLQNSVDSVGSPTGLLGRLALARFVAPVLPFLVLAAQSPDSLGSLDALMGSVPKSQVAAIVLGILTYKAPLVLQTGSEAIDSLSEVDVKSGKTGMIGVTAGLAARALKKKKDPEDSETESSTNGAKLDRIVFVFAGPSGAGKSTLIKRLFQAYPDKFSFSVSHTTRSPRAREEEGVNYNFVSETEFETMIDRDEFIEYAKVHGNYYGTSKVAVDKILEKERICILDLDVQGVQALSTKYQLGWSPRFIWVAPPSLEMLKRRLKKRKSETEETLAKRLETATREMSFAATSKVFDLILINDDIDRAFDELAQFIERSTSEA